MEHRTLKSDQHHPRSKNYAGKYGRLFRQLPPVDLSDVKIQALIDSLSSAGITSQAGAPGNIPAGYTYFGQFIDHDITFDPVSFAVRNRDPDSLINVRTPALDLDSVYGGGPGLDPYLYTYDSNSDSQQFFLDKPGLTRVPHSEEPDLLRRKELQGTESYQATLAIIPDPRNDEHLIISQMHLAFQLLHNKICDNLSGFGTLEQFPFESGTNFSRARQLLLWHYQWLLVNDYLPRICNSDALGNILGPGWSRGSDFPAQVNLRYFDHKFNPYIPLEFSGAAFRFGHSMVRNHYRVNEKINPHANSFVPVFSPGKSRDLTGSRVLRPSWSIQWNLFLDDPGGNPGDYSELQFANLIDRSLSSSLLTVPQSSAGSISLVEANIRRGMQLRLPSGQAVARLMGVPAGDILQPEAGIEEDPLWLYVLKEARQGENGNGLGEVGSTIVAETLIGLLMADSFSFVNIFPGWKPFLSNNPEKISTDISTYGLFDLFSWGDLPMTKADIDELTR